MYPPGGRIHRRCKLRADRRRWATIREGRAKAEGLPTEVHAPDYQQHYPKAAPLERNRLLVGKADAVLALYAPGRERKGGTWDTVQKAVAVGLPIVEAYPDGSTTYTPPPVALW